MAAVNAADWSVAVNGDIRYTGSGTTNTVIELHRWLGDLMDDAQASGNDLLDITSATASARATDNFITLNSPFNIDAYSAQFLYDGSIVQGAGGTDIWDGIVCYAPAGTYLYIIQNGKVLSPNFWTTTKNPDATAGISHRFMVKTRSGGADIDGRRLIGLARVWGKTYAEFKVAPTARGNNTVALSPVSDLNNVTAVATAKGWTTITNTEGYRLIDVDVNSTDEKYYSEWNKAALSINQFYERTKFLSKGSTAEASNLVDTGTAFQLANATIIGQAQSFANGVQAQYLTRALAKIRKVGSPTGNLTAVLYAHSGTFGSSSIPTGAALATSDAITPAQITTAYQTIEFGFSTQYEMAASTNYCIAFEHAAVDGSNYFEIDGLAASGTHAGNRSQLVSTTWTPTAGDDLYFQVDASSKLYGLPGEVFRGVTHEIPVWGATGTMAAVEAVSWTGGTGQLLAIDSTTAGRRAWIQLLTGVAPSAALTITGTGTVDTNNNPITTTATSGTGSVATITFAAQTVLPYPAGTTITVAGVTPTAYNGTFISTGGTTTTVTYASSATGAQSVAGTVTGDVLERNLSFPFVGASTGSALIGAYGLGVEAADLTSNDKVFDLDNAQIVPPNNVTFTVSGLVATVDRLLVGPEDGAGGLKVNQLTLSTDLTADPETAVVCTTAIPDNTPASGTIRIQMNSGIYRLINYSVFSGSTFTISGTENFSADQATGAKNIFISYIDKAAGATSENFQTIFDSAQTLFIRVRDGVDDANGPIKTAETTGSLTSTGGSVSINRVLDE